MVIALVVAGILIAFFELAAWWLFRRKLEGLVFPGVSDGSDLPLFTVQRLRAIAVLHGVWLLAVCVITILYVW